jgi:cysteine desulfurase family protein
LVTNKRETLYANYAATSPFLSERVVQETISYLGGEHLNAGRNFEGLQAGSIALRAREAVGRLIGVTDPLRVIFTSGATASLNTAINGLVRPGCHVLSTSVEHNAVARPLEALRKSGVIELDWLACGRDGSLGAGAVASAIRDNTRLLVMTAASNVLGTILPVRECVQAARERGVFTVIDMAAAGGSLPFDMGGCDATAFAGHKGLGALAGVGVLALSASAAKEMRPRLLGGTGSFSHALEMPEFLPDKFEAGTQNTVGILSLAASAEELAAVGIENIRKTEAALTKRFMDGLRGMKKITVFGSGDPLLCLPLVSIAVKNMDSGEVSGLLFERNGIITRSGLHCAPLAHKTAGTFPQGTVRFSFGRGTTEADIDAILDAIESL